MWIFSRKRKHTQNIQYRTENIIVSEISLKQHYVYLLFRFDSVQTTSRYEKPQESDFNNITIIMFLSRRDKNRFMPHRTTRKCLAPAVELV